MNQGKLELPERQNDVTEALNTLARHQAIAHLLSDIAVDLMVCEMEGWNPEEYINLLKSEIDRIYNKYRGAPI